MQIKFQQALTPRQAKLSAIKKKKSIVFIHNLESITMIKDDPHFETSLTKWQKVFGILSVVFNKYVRFN